MTKLEEEIQEAILKTPWKMETKGPLKGEEYEDYAGMAQSAAEVAKKYIDKAISELSHHDPGDAAYEEWLKENGVI